MNNLRQYIIEKFKISKDIGKNNSSISIEVINLILDYLEKNKYFNYNVNDYKIVGKTDKDLGLILPKEIKRSLIDTIGVDLSIKMERELKLDLYWSWDEDNHKLSWGEDFI